MSTLLRTKSLSLSPLRNASFSSSSLSQSPAISDTRSPNTHAITNIERINLIHEFDEDDNDNHDIENDHDTENEIDFEDEFQPGQSCIAIHQEAEMNLLFNPFEDEYKDQHHPDATISKVDVNTRILSSHCEINQSTANIGNNRDSINSQPGLKRHNNATNELTAEFHERDVSCSVEMIPPFSEPETLDCLIDTTPYVGQMTADLETNINEVNQDMSMSLQQVAADEDDVPLHISSKRTNRRRIICDSSSDDTDTEQVTNVSSKQTADTALEKSAAVAHNVATPRSLRPRSKVGQETPAELRNKILSHRKVIEEMICIASDEEDNVEQENESDSFDNFIVNDDLADAVQNRLHFGDEENVNDQNNDSGDRIDSIEEKKSHYELQIGVIASKVFDSQSLLPVRPANRQVLVVKWLHFFDDRVFNHQLAQVTVNWNDKLRSTAGLCKCRRGVFTDKSSIQGRLAIISLSIKVVDTESKLVNTLAHEMCHAATHLIDNLSNRSKPHGQDFQRWAKLCELSCSGLNITVCHNYEIHHKFRWQCKNCHNIIGRHSNSLNVQKYRCKCSGELIALGSFNKDNTPMKKRPAKGFAQFVASNYSKIKLKGITHKEAMQQLSTEWKKFKEISSTADDNEIINLKLSMK